MEKIWLSTYPKGVPPEIPPLPYPSLSALCEDACKKYSKDVAFDNFNVTLTYGQYKILAERFASYLQHGLGLKKGDRIAIMLPNTLQYPVVMLGIFLMGGVIVNINPLYTPRELEHQLKDSGATTIIILENFAHTLEACIKNTEIKHVITTQIGDLFPTLKRYIFNFVVKRIKKLVPPWHLENSISFPDALSQGDIEPYHPVELFPEDVAFLQYTGGTTGVAKGAELTHRNMVSNVMQASLWLGAYLKEGERQVVVSPLPLYHIFSLTANLLLFIYLGAKDILITNPREISLLIRLIKNKKFTVITGVNTLFNALLHNPHFKEIDFSHLRCPFGGGMAVQSGVAEEWFRRTGYVLSEGYGLTECSPAVTINRFDEDHFTGSIGLPVPSTEISIRNEQGEEVPLGEEGELCIRGPQVMRGYWKNPEETARAFYPGGWFRTGDLVKMDEKGFIYLLERKKDMIIVSGFNVYPTEVEDVLGRHPDIKEVAVIGVISPAGDEQVKAVIVPKVSTLTPEAVIAYARTQLTGYKVPKVVEFVTELPKTPVGKVLRRALREGTQ